MFDMRHRHLGFSLIEVVIATAIFLLFGLGIYSGMTAASKIVYNSRLLILETGILNEQVEIIRNLSFYDVGIANGSPSGVLNRVVTTTRNGIDFTITRTIRNIDDPFDGTVTSSPRDTAAADYKIVQIDVICTDCGQHRPQSFTTYVSPRYLEGDPTHGALFIQVVDGSANPVQGASVHVVATTTSPTVDFVDTTDNDGMLRLVDLAQGFQAYHITVTKDGYTSDGTMVPTEQVPGPIHPPASVVAQDVTEVAFTIDRAATIALSTKNATCDELPSVQTTIAGTKLIATSPDIFKNHVTVTTNASGAATVTSLDWDTYFATSTGYDVLGTIPQIPLTLPAGATQTLDMILGPNTAHSLVVDVRDSITGQPLSQASVTVTGGSTNVTKSTGVGFIRQTDWSEGDGQAVIGDASAYYAQDGNIDDDESEGDLVLSRTGERYVASGYLESSTFDVGTTPSYVNLVWEPLAQPVETGEGSLRFQLATAIASTTNAWTFLGPDGTTSTYYDASTPVVASVHNGERYLRYRTYLSTASSTVTPMLSDVTVSFANSCTPPGQAYFGSLTSGEYRVQVVRSGYQAVDETLTVSGDVRFGISMVSN